VVLDDVVTDDMDDLAAFGDVRVRFRAISPDRLPVVLLGTDAFGVLFRRGDVLDRSVDPHVQDEILLALARVVDPPVHIAGDTEVL